MQPGTLKLETPQSLFEHANFAGSLASLQKRKIVYGERKEEETSANLVQKHVSLHLLSVKLRGSISPIANSFPSNMHLLSSNFLKSGQSKRFAQQDFAP